VIVFVGDVLFFPFPTNLYDSAESAVDHVNVSEVLDEFNGVHPPVISGAEITTLQPVM